MRSQLAGSFFLGALLALSSSLAVAADEQTAFDEDSLKKAGVAVDAAGLRGYLQKQTLRDADRQQLETWVRLLGDEAFGQREGAMARLTAAGRTALPFLRPALRSADAEVVSRARRCIQAIDAGPGPGLSAAAVRLLALRAPTEAVAVLLPFFPFAEDQQVEDEVLNSLSQLGLAGGKVHPALATALKEGPADQRRAAAFVLARAGLAPQRSQVRQLLADPDETVRQYVVRGLIGDRMPEVSREETQADEKRLKEAGFSPDAAGALAFLRKRTLTDADRRQLLLWVRQLGDDSFLAREDASAKLVAQGSPALPFLRDALVDPDAEIVRRAERCLQAIERGPGAALPIAALRLLVQQHPPGAIPVLLGYVPFADDETVVEEVLAGLCILAAQAAEIDAELPRSLQDPLAARRAAAAYALGRVGAADHVQALHSLLADADPRVRLRAAQGLLAVRDRAAVPILLGLLMEKSPEITQPVEEALQKIAGDRAPTVALAGAGAEVRKKTQDAWAAWWRDQGAGLELAPLEQGQRHLGLTLVAELDSNRVWEYGRDGKVRWELTGLQGPIDAQVLPGGRVLIAEHQGQRVTERDLQGKVLWEKRVNGNPVVCQRLPNGNTFIATYNKVMEVDRETKEIYSFDANPNPGFPIIYGAHKMRNGRIVVISGQGMLAEYDVTGKRLLTTQVGNNGGWCSVEGQPNGRYLVALTNGGRVVEVDASGKAHGQWVVPGAAHATRLPNGNILVASMNNRRVVELNQGGTQVSEKTTTGRPFHVHRR